MALQLHDFLNTPNFPNPTAQTGNTIAFESRFGRTVQSSQYYKYFHDQGYMNGLIPVNTAMLNGFLRSLLQFLIDRRLGFVEPCGIGYKISGLPTGFPFNYGAVEFDCVVTVVGNRTNIIIGRFHG